MFAQQGKILHVNLSEDKIKNSQPDYQSLYKKRSDDVAKNLASVDNNKVKDALDNLSKVSNDVSGEVIDRGTKAVIAGATIGGITKALRPKDEKTEIKPVNIHRGAARFESLRKASEDYAAKSGSLPNVFFAKMGPVKQHKARADFSAGFFNVGAFEVISSEGFQNVDDAAKAALSSGSKVVVICSTDDTYPDIVPDLTRKIKEGNSEIMVVLAGLPKDYVDSFKEAGVDEFIHIRSNVSETLEKIQRKLGVIS